LLDFATLVEVVHTGQVGASNGVGTRTGKLDSAVSEVPHALSIGTKEGLVVGAFNGGSAPVFTERSGGTRSVSTLVGLLDRAPVGQFTLVPGRLAGFVGALDLVDSADQRNRQTNLDVADAGAVDTPDWSRRGTAVAFNAL